MIVQVDLNKIEKDCTDMIAGLESRVGLLPEAYYYRGRARYYKGVKDEDLSSIGNALDDFERAAHDGNADLQIRAEAFYYCGLCWEKLGNRNKSKDYFRRAKESGLTNKSLSHDLGTIIPKVGDLKKRGMEKLGITKDAR